MLTRLQSSRARGSRRLLFRADRITVKRVDHRISARLLFRVTRRQQDHDVAIDGVALEIAFERRPVDLDVLFLARSHLASSFAPTTVRGTAPRRNGVTQTDANVGWRKRMRELLPCLEEERFNFVEVETETRNILIWFSYRFALLRGPSI